MRARTSLGLSIVWTLGFGVDAARADGSDEHEKHRRALELLQGEEKPDDPPGIPALPVPGAPPSAPVVFGGFSAVQVNVDGAGANIPGDAANETSLAVDPTAPNRMVIGWRQFDTIASNFRQAGWGYTTDGGRTWTFPGVIDGGVFRSDPVLAFDAEGNFYYNSLTVTQQSEFLCTVYPSQDRGQSWEPGTFAFGGDKQWMAVDRSGGIGDGHIYTAWSVFAGCCGNDDFNRSVDGNQSYEMPLEIPDTPVFGTMDVGADGAVYVAGMDPGDFSTMLVAKSTNAQNAAVTPSFVFTTPVDLGGTITLSAGPNPAGLLGQVNLKVDPGNSQNVYLLASVDPPGADPLDVRFSRSVDGGVTWSPSVRVNDDASGNWQWFGTMSVAPNGRIDVVWNDTRTSGQDNISELFMSSSADGGVTWAPNQQLSPAFDSFLGWPQQNKMGDYFDMVSDDVGAHLAWAATFNGEQDVYYLRIGDYDCNGNGIGDEVDLAMMTSLDANSNDIPDECECSSFNYCTSTPNTSGSSAKISFTGSLSIGANDTTLIANGCAQNKFGIFFYGPTRLQATFGEGFRCVGAGGVGTFRLQPPQMTNFVGSLSRPLDLTAPPANAGAGMVTPFATWDFQFWFRDPAGGPSGFNLTDGLELTFCP